jgi:hypothetical protein
LHFFACFYFKDFLRHPQVRGDEILAEKSDLQQVAQNQDHPMVQADQSNRDSHGIQPAKGKLKIIHWFKRISLAVTQMGSTVLAKLR